MFFFPAGVCSLYKYVYNMLIDLSGTHTHTLLKLTFGPARHLFPGLMDRHDRTFFLVKVRSRLQFVLFKTKKIVGSSLADTELCGGGKPLRERRSRRLSGCV